MDWLGDKDSDLKKKLKYVEEWLDVINGDYGTKEAYCIFCESKKYDSRQGIIHQHYCIISQLRARIRRIK
jgi:hypothetical protein